MSNILHFLYLLLGSSGAGVMMSPIWRDSRNKGLVATVIVTTVVVAGAALSPYIPNPGGGPPPPPPPPPGDKANLWVDLDGGTCSRQSTPASYSSPSACSSFQTAYNASLLGDTVRVVAGTYSSQTMWYDANKASETNDSDVQIIANGAVNIGSFSGYGVRHVTLDGFSISGSLILYCQDSGLPNSIANGRHPVDVTVKNGSMSFFRSENASMFTVSGNNIGPSSSVIKIGASSDTGGANCTDQAPSNQVIENNTIHDFREASALSHMECIFVEGVQGLVIRRNKISGCSVFDIFFKQQLSAGAFGMSNITVENNMLGHPVQSDFRSAGDDSFSLSSGTYNNVTIRDNSINGQLLLRTDTTANYTNVNVFGNIAQYNAGAPGCALSGVTWDDNAYMNSSTKCANDVADGIVPDWVDTETSAEINSSTSDPTIDYHLSSGSSWPVGKGNASTSSSDDYDQQTRPQSGTYDLGADER